MKYDLPYFSHYNSTHSEPRMQALLAEYGFEGYGRFWVLCEKIAASPNAYLDISSRVIKMTIARTLELSAEDFDSFIGFLSAPDIELVRVESGIITTDQLQEDYHRVTTKRKKDRDEYNKKNPTTELAIPLAENIQSRVEYSTIKKSSGNEKSEKQPPLFFDIKNQIKTNGFFIDDNNALEVLISETDPAWYTGHTFIDFIVAKVRGTYGEKPADEQHRVFRKLLFNAPNLREAYPQWREQQEKDDAARAQKKARDKAIAAVPKKCPTCGALLKDGLRCPENHGVFSFQENEMEYRFFETRDGNELAAEFNERIRRRQGIAV